jgi:hypothetical protein
MSFHLEVLRQKRGYVSAKRIQIWKDSESLTDRCIIRRWSPTLLFSERPNVLCSSWNIILSVNFLALKRSSVHSNCVIHGTVFIWSSSWFKVDRKEIITFLVSYDLRPRTSVSRLFCFLHPATGPWTHTDRAVRNRMRLAQRTGMSLEEWWASSRSFITYALHQICSIGWG